MKKIVITITMFYCITVILTACGGSSDEAREDLQKLANSVDSLSISTGDTPSSNSNNKAQIDTRSNHNIELDEFSDERGTYSITSEYFAADGTTPITQEESMDLNDYVVRQKQKFRTNQYESNFSAVYEYSNVDGLGFPDMIANGSATIDYYNDDLLLSADSVYLKLQYEGEIHIRYEMSFFNKQYSFVLEVKEVFQDYVASTENAQNTAVEMISAEIFNANGQHVGYFILNHDDSVVIKDAGGNVIQAAG